MWYWWRARGYEPYQEIGGERFDFNDKVVVGGVFLNQALGMRQEALVNGVVPTFGRNL